MEESREQQRSPASPVTVPPVYAPPGVPPYYYPPPSVARPGVWAKMTRITRLLLRRTLYGLVLVGRPLRPIAGFLVIMLALLGVISWMAFRIWGPQPGAPTFQRAESLAPAPAVESYMQGRQSFNADLMWDSYSSDYQTTQLERGASKATLQSQADNERLMGVQYLHADYIGGLQTEGGGGMFFYSVDISVQNQKLKLPIVFTANAEGKIENIISPLNRVNSQ